MPRRSTSASARTRARHWPSGPAAPPGLELLVTTGGASVGDYDLVQRVLGSEGMALDFWKIAMRPGKPLLLGRLGDVPVLGFPGNPVSTAVCALVFLRAALQKMMGLTVGLRTREVEIVHALQPNDLRQDYLRANYVTGSAGVRVRTAGRQDSSMLATFARVGRAGGAAALRSRARNRVRCCRPLTSPRRWIT